MDELVQTIDDDIVGSVGQHWGVPVDGSLTFGAAWQHQHLCWPFSLASYQYKIIIKEAPFLENTIPPLPSPPKVTWLSFWFQMIRNGLKYMQ